MNSTIRLKKEQSLNEYFFRINRAIDYIKSNLDEDLSLDKLAEVSNFSKFHFHRIFKALTGTTLNNFIKNARVQRAMFYLINNPCTPISDIAYQSGFATETSFFRSFKEVHGITATEFRDSHQKENSKNCKQDSNIGSLEKETQQYLASKIYNLKTMSMDNGKAIEVEVKELSELHVVYVRNLNIRLHDSETFGKMFDALMRWAAPRGLVNFPETKALTVYRSNPNLEGMIQADVCLTVPEETEGEGFIGRTTLSGGMYAVVHKEATMAECFSTWDYIFEDWFPANGYQPDNRNFYINHLNEAEKHPQKLHIFDMCIPVKPL
ncbi:AraC family transcriptional regulator [Pontibacter sp. BT310]|uniref:AraC family transcriptional regulator n=1 Tax=Pontibacter populi TaxID=890055 RepID=A0ABS6XFU7_9BACT|nr:MULTISPECIES: AraC family transcriptional regulator [Pontibacter]MBJ6119540.1 AraC family transcriptional regulator [Pontibacter sp. BT310]MBR0571967.1 AraC family transcriptional regulator [Microvirga sp. STS03]MBW3366393.1 AraC family transcriptional regulator [Pontibacter populi]